MNPKCLGTSLPDTFSARSAHLTGLKMIRITRAGSSDDRLRQRIAGEPGLFRGLEYYSLFHVAWRKHKDESCLLESFVWNPTPPFSVLELTCGFYGTSLLVTPWHSPWSSHPGHTRRSRNFHWAERLYL